MILDPNSRGTSMPRVVSHSYWIYSGTDHLIGVWKDVSGKTSPPRRTKTCHIAYRELPAHPPLDKIQSFN